jgi:hypothetical protein
LFCDRDADGKPFNSHHTLWGEGLWVGSVFRDSIGSAWQWQLIGAESPRGACDYFADAIDSLWQWKIQRDRDFVPIESFVQKAKKGPNAGTLAMMARKIDW